MVGNHRGWAPYCNSQHAGRVLPGPFASEHKRFIFGPCGDAA